MGEREVSLQKASERSLKSPVRITGKPVCACSRLTRLASSAAATSRQRSLPGWSCAGRVVDVDEPHLASGRVVLEQDVGHAHPVAVEVGDRDRLGADRRPDVALPGDGVADRVAAELEPRIDATRAARHPVEGTELGRLELLEADHVDPEGADQPQRPCHALRPGAVAGLVPAVGRVRGAEHVEAAHAERRGRNGWSLGDLFLDGVQQALLRLLAVLLLRGPSSTSGSLSRDAGRDLAAQGSPDPPAPPVRSSSTPLGASPRATRPSIPSRSASPRS